MIEFHINDIARKSTIVFWPPIVYPSSKHVSPIYYFLLLLIKSSKKPEKILSWIICDLFPTQWTVSTQKPPLYAISLLKGENKVVNYAILDEERVLHVYTPKQNSSYGYKSLFAERTSRAKITDEGKLNIYGPIGNLVQKLELNEPKLSKFWEQVYSSSPPHFFSFLTEIALPYPSLLYQSIYRQIVHVDLIPVHAFSKPGVIKPENYSDLLKSLFTIGFYSQKFIPIVSTIILSVYEIPTVTAEYVSSPLCIVHHIAPALLSAINNKEFIEFKDKIINYIKSKEKFNILEKPEELGKTFFTTMKYILDAASLLPMSIRQIASLISTFATIRFNSRNDLITILSDFYSSLFTDFCLKDKDFNVTEVRKLVYMTFKYNKLIPKYSFPGWNERIEKKFVPLIHKLVFELAKPINNVEYQAPSLKKLDESLGCIVGIIVKNQKSILKEVNELESGKFRTTCLSWLFASSLVLQFDFLENDDVKAAKAPPMIGLSPLFMDKKRSLFFSALSLGIDCTKFLNDDQQTDETEQKPINVYDENGEQQNIEETEQTENENEIKNEINDVQSNDDFVAYDSVSSSSTTSVFDYPFAEPIVDKRAAFVDYPIVNQEQSDISDFSSSDV
ncbi:hypothetical protein TVAG_160800 [Trichomonas vaginalis G3]|uniref:Uncharacterized protein n=1 Tax=Trichomonas vaginalis (strain ATCC PRA-98 / G3) TaxID=412133 RepID=A2E4T5_TRIV3|nr:hypothetical protein TVAGG3_0227790 [Trichomonas vaginalis G3]EAY12274.1 hypothetical protein TVAG_160800 [Trichomonas vaginalis G3]KAI5552390.1 hypothetical protein TVAGG3_0227790 [Trichomonas vaginalis G3]|eukprot:XP_001324497.1 hypothetical protein [Trichomonas vaginalis G3]